MLKIFWIVLFSLWGITFLSIQFHHHWSMSKTNTSTGKSYKDFVNQQEDDSDEDEEHEKY